MKDRIKNNDMNPEYEKKSHNAMFLFFNSVLSESKEEKKKSSISDVKELYLPSDDKKLVNSRKLLCTIPPRHIQTIARLSYHVLYSFENCGLQRELESKYLEALPVRLRPKPFDSVVEEKLDESCLEKTCRLCKTDEDCDFIKKFKALLKSKEFKDGIIRLLKHQKKSGSLTPEEEQAASRLFLNQVEIKCMETVEVHLMLADTKVVLEGSSASRNSYVVKQYDAWTLYMERGSVRGNLMKSINKLLGWRIKDKLLIVVSDMLNCSTSLEIPEVLNHHDIELDAGGNEEVKLGSEVPVVFHQLLQQNPLFVFHTGERVAYCDQLPDHDEDDDEEDDEFSPTKYILAEILKLVTSSPVECAYDLGARYLIDIGSAKIEVSVLDLYKFYEKYPDENSCTDLVLFTGDAKKLPESYEEAKREILEALRAAWCLPADLRWKAIKRLYLRWHPDKNPGNVEFATEMMAFLLKQVKRMMREERAPERQPEKMNNDNKRGKCSRQATQERATQERAPERQPKIFNCDKLCKRWSRQATREKATFQNYRSNSSFYGSRFGSLSFHSAATYTSSNPSEASRWIEQAEGDLSACRFLLTAMKPFHALVCFLSQQIVENSLKAALYAECGLTDDQLHSHDVYSLASNVQSLQRWKRTANIDVVKLALVVAHYYLSTRYPNQQRYPIVPFNAFDDKSRDAIRSAEDIVREVKKFIRP